jgi:hypothetical protein
MAWRMPAECDNCPFSKSGPGAHLRRSLAPGRFAEIKQGLLNGAYFNCHKTVEYDDEGEGIPGVGLMCAGAIAFQEHAGTVSNYQRVAERLDRITRHKLVPVREKRKGKP